MTLIEMEPVAELKRIRKMVSRALFLLDGMGHHGQCNISIHPRRECDCGLQEAFDTLRLALSVTDVPAHNSTTHPERQ